MKKRFRLAQVIFNRFQLSAARTLSKGLKGDLLWESLSGSEHQAIGKMIAKYNNIFANNCPSTVNANYSYTDNHGNGIYH